MRAPRAASSARPRPLALSPPPHTATPSSRGAATPSAASASWDSCRCARAPSLHSATAGASCMASAGSLSRCPATPAGPLWGPAGPRVTSSPAPVDSSVPAPPPAFVTMAQSGRAACPMCRRPGLQEGELAPNLLAKVINFEAGLSSHFCPAERGQGRPVPLIFLLAPFLLLSPGRRRWSRSSR